MRRTMGQTIAALRLGRGMTQERLAREMGVSAQAVSKWENDLNYPDVALIVPLSRVLGTTADELLGAAMPPTAEAGASAQPARAPASQPGLERPAAGSLAVAGDPAPASEPASSPARAASLHVLVDGSDHVNISIPLDVVRFAAKMGMGVASSLPAERMPENARAIMEELDMSALLGMVEQCEPGTLVNVRDDSNVVRITLE